MMFKSNGIIRYEDSKTAGLKLIVKVDVGIYYYYRSLIPKSIYINPQKYSPHISVVRNELPQMENWGKYDGKEVEFFYAGDIQNSELYYWLNVYSTDLENIRKELGLPIMKHTCNPPLGFNTIFHITLGNKKKVD